MSDSGRTEPWNWTPPAPGGGGLPPYPMSGGPSAHPHGEQFWPAPGRTSPPPVSGPDLDFTAPGPHRAPTPPPPRKRRRQGSGWLRWVVVAVVLLVVAGLTGVYVYRDRLDGASVAPGASEGQGLNRPAPPGWTSEVAWSHEVGSTPALVAMANRVAFIEDGRLVVLEADSGALEFRSPALRMSPNASPIVTKVSGRSVVGVQDGAMLTLWRMPSPNGSAGTQVQLPLNARVFGQMGGLLFTSGTQAWRLNSDLELDEVTIPPDHVSLGVTGESELLTAPEEGEWTFTDTSGEQRVVKANGKPAGTEGEMKVAWASRGVIVAWGAMRDPSRRTVGFYESDNGELLAEGRLSAQQVADGMPLTVSEHGANASAGPLLADLRTGDVEVVPGWSTVMSNSSGLFGTVNGTRQFWSSESGTTELEPGTGVPWGVSNSGLAIVLDPLPSGGFALVGLRPRVN